MGLSFALGMSGAGLPDTPRSSVEVLSIREKRTDWKGLPHGQVVQKAVQNDDPSSKGQGTQRCYVWTLEHEIREAGPPWSSLSAYCASPFAGFTGSMCSTPLTTLGGPSG